MFVSHLHHIAEDVKRNAIAHFPPPIAGKIACHLISGTEAKIWCVNRVWYTVIAIGHVIHTLRKRVCIDKDPTRTHNSSANA